MSRDKVRGEIKKIAQQWFKPDGFASQTMPNDRSFDGDILSIEGLEILDDDQSPPEIPEELIESNIKLYTDKNLITGDIKSLRGLLSLIEQQQTLNFYLKNWKKVLPK